jgi:hypothetical protein
MRIETKVKTSFDDKWHGDIRRSRSASMDSASSDALVLDQGPIQRCIGSIEAWFASSTIVRKVCSPFRRLESTSAMYQSKSRFHGWKMGILIGCWMSASILLFNITVVIVVAVKTGFKGDIAELPFTFNAEKMYVPLQTHSLTDIR